MSLAASKGKPPAWWEEKQRIPGSPDQEVPVTNGLQPSPRESRCHCTTGVLSPLPAAPAQPVVRPPPGTAGLPSPLPAGSRSAERRPESASLSGPRRDISCNALLEDLCSIAVAPLPVRMHCTRAVRPWLTLVANRALKLQPRSCITDLFQFLEGAGAAGCLHLESQDAAEQGPCLRLTQRPQTLAQCPRQQESLLQVLVFASLGSTPETGWGWW